MGSKRIVINRVVIIGAGLAGCEAALQLAERGMGVTLYEQKPKYMSSAHSMQGFGELVCSNSLKSLDPYTAHGLLKQELQYLGCRLLEIAKECSVPAGSALAVDRQLFSDKVTDAITSNANISVVYDRVDSLNFDDSLVIVATGPLTEGKLYDEIQGYCGESLHFFDAVSPIVTRESIDFDRAFVGDRYGKTVGGSASYINCTLSKDEYYAFYDALIAAERADREEWDRVEYFNGCMPIEAIASKGKDCMRFGPMKPVGITDESGKRPYAVLQLRQENFSAEAYNLVGFQTGLKWSEQKRVFGLIPALANAEFVRYGVMHRNSYVNAPSVLAGDMSLRARDNIYIAGQLSGVEGYVESIMSGLVVAINCFGRLTGKPMLRLDDRTMIGSILKYLGTPSKSFAPMNANFGLLPHINIKNKDERKRAYCEASAQTLSHQT